MPNLDPILETERIPELERLIPVLTEKLISHIKSDSIGPTPAPEELLELFDDLPDSVENGLDRTINKIDQVLDNSVVTWNPGFLDKLYAGTNPVGLASDMILSVLNTNSHVYTVSPALTVIEQVVSKKYAELFGYTGKFAGGLTFPGGSYSNSTALVTARNYLFPEVKKEGNGNKRFAVFASKHSHYSVEKAAIWCGMGSDAVYKVNVSDEGCLIPQEFEKSVEQALKDGRTPLAVVATSGTTVYGAFDDLVSISKVAKKYSIWLHIDGSWGGNIVFSESEYAKQVMAGSNLADSITVNPHKALGIPTTCSFLLLPDVRLLQKANSLNAPYLFHSTPGSSTDLENAENEPEPTLFYDLADGTMGCGRRPDALKLYLGWSWFGKEGYSKRIDHARAVAGHLATSIQNSPNFYLVSSNPPPFLQVCFYYIPVSAERQGDEYPVQSLNDEKTTQITRSLVKQLHKSGKFLVDYAPGPYGEFFRVVVNSPLVGSEVVDSLVKEIEKIGTQF